MAPRPPLRKLEGPHGRGTGPASRPLPKPSPPRASTPARGGHASRLPANGRAVGLAPARGLQRRGGAGSESGPEEAACAPWPPTVEGEGLPLGSGRPHTEPPPRVQCSRTYSVFRCLHELSLDQPTTGQLARRPALQRGPTSPPGFRGPRLERSRGLVRKCDCVCTGRSGLYTHVGSSLRG